MERLLRPKVVFMKFYLEAKPFGPKEPDKPQRVHVYEMFNWSDFTSGVVEESHKKNYPREYKKFKEEIHADNDAAFDRARDEYLKKLEEN